MAESNAVFGGEHSGHFYFRDFWRADSGMLAALYAISTLGRSELPLSEILSTFSIYHSSGEINSTVEDAESIMREIEESFISQEEFEVDHLDGLTISAADWWFNLRASNTEPLLRLNVEAREKSRMVTLRDDVLNRIRQ